MTEHDDAGGRQPWKPSPYPRSRPEGTTPPAEPVTDSGEDADAGAGSEDPDAPTAANEPALGAEPAPEPEATAANGQPPGAKHRRGRGFGRIGVRIVVALFSVVALLVTGYAYTIVNDLQGGVHTSDPLDDLGGQDDPAAPPKEDNAIDILLVGTDARTDMQGNPLPPRMLDTLSTEQSSGINTDTLIVLRVPKDGSEPSAVSIPRDTWVKTPSGDKSKINAVFGETKARATDKLAADDDTDDADIALESDQAGRKELVRTVQRFTGVHIDHYAEVNLLGFYLLTKALGGVTVCLKQPTKDEDSGADFPAGEQELDASEALSFVRQRKNLPEGLDRIHRQQAFLASALREVLSAGTLSDSDKLDDLADAAHRSMVLDPDLDLLQFADRMKGLASDDVSFETIPVKTVNGHTSDGLSIVKTDADEVRNFMADLVDHSAASTTTSSPDPTGPDGTGSGGGSDRPAAYHPTAASVPCVY